MTWITLTREQAQQHPLYGLGGWSALLMVFLVLALLLGGAPLGYFDGELLNIARQQSEATGRSIPELMAFFKGQSAVAQTRSLLIAFFWLNAGVFATSIYLLARKRPAFRATYVGGQAAVAAFGVYVANDTVELSVSDIVGIVAPSALWCWYVLVSQRIRVTTCGAVNDNDPWYLEQQASAAAASSAPGTASERPMMHGAGSSLELPPPLPPPAAAATTYRVVLEGRTLGNAPVPEVARRLAEIFPMPEEQWLPFLDGCPHIVRTRVGRDEAERYRVAIERAGAAVHLQPEGVGESTLQSA